MIATLSEKAAVFSAMDLTLVRQAGLATNTFARTWDRRRLARLDALFWRKNYRYWSKHEYNYTVSEQTPDSEAIRETMLCPFGRVTFLHASRSTSKDCDIWRYQLWQFNIPYWLGKEWLETKLSTLIHDVKIANSKDNISAETHMLHLQLGQT